MEIMSEFKVGVKVEIIRLGKSDIRNLALKIGDVRAVTAIGASGVQLDGIESGWVHDEDVKLAKPKWSIYSNELPWEKLSNKQKGKMLLAAHSGVKFKNFTHHQPTFNTDIHVYVAIKPELPTVKKPTMEELFVADWSDCMGDIDESAIQIIAKGWNKSCK